MPKVPTFGWIRSDARLDEGHRSGEHGQMLDHRPGPPPHRYRAGQPCALGQQRGTAVGQVQVLQAQDGHEARGGGGRQQPQDAAQAGERRLGAGPHDGPGHRQPDRDDRGKGQLRRGRHVPEELMDHDAGGRDRDDGADVAENLGHQGQPAARSRSVPGPLGGLDPAGLVRIDQASRGPAIQLLPQHRCGIRIRHGAALPLVRRHAACQFMLPRRRGRSRYSGSVAEVLRSASRCSYARRLDR